MRARASATLAAAALALTACPRKDIDHVPTRLAVPSVPPPVQLPDGGMRHTERLAWIGWRGDGAFGACGRRTGDFTVAGQLRGCVVVEKPGARPSPREWTADHAFVRDETAVDRAPAGCRVIFDDAPGDPGAPPARATLYTRSARRALDEWKAPATVDGDYFAIETSYSPDGRWLAVLHTAVGLGADDRTVDLAGIDLRPAPPCD